MSTSQRSQDHQRFLRFVEDNYCPVVFGSDDTCPSGYDIDENLIFLKHDNFLILAHEVSHFLDLYRFFLDEPDDDDFQWSCYKEMIAVLGSYYILKFFEALRDSDLKNIAEDVFYYENLTSNRLKNRADERAFELIKKFATEYNEFLERSV